MPFDTLSYPYDAIDLDVGIVEPPIRESDINSFDKEPSIDAETDREPTVTLSEGGAESGQDLLRSHYGGSDEHYTAGYDGFTYEWVTENGIINSEGKDAIESLSQLPNTTEKMLEDQRRVADHFAGTNEPLFFDDTKETDEGTLILVTVIYLDSEKGIHTASGEFLIPKETKEQGEVSEEPLEEVEHASGDVDENDAEPFAEEDEFGDAEVTFDIASLFAKREQAFQQSLLSTEIPSNPVIAQQVSENIKNPIDVADQPIAETVPAQPTIYQVIQKVIARPAVSELPVEHSSPANSKPELETMPASIPLELSAAAGEAEREVRITAQERAVDQMQNTEREKELDVEKTATQSLARTESDEKVASEILLTEEGVAEDRKEVTRPEAAPAVSVKPIGSVSVEVLTPKASGITMTEVQKPSENAISIPDTDPKVPSGGSSFEKTLPVEETIVSNVDRESSDDGPGTSPDTLTMPASETEMPKTEEEVPEVKKTAEVVHIPLGNYAERKEIAPESRVRTERSQKEIEGMALYARTLRTMSHPRETRSAESRYRARSGAVAAVDERERRSPSTRSISRNGVTMRRTA